ncbi:pumilio homology domain family member [Anaeramoeba flamelloides]|uniref:Pumilio homology domain family member n=1 Tax=Anaeramoeba flamelloides TaxID=1746091 RepID=A0AAV7ZSM2_9EUKA|nr:pumilio homology domain family member [Anaeramoeba flamelloides]
MQKCLEVATEKYQRLLTKKIISHTIDLIQNQYGHFVIKYMLKSNICVEEIIQKIQKNILYLSTQQISSNIVEKCLNIANQKLRESLIDEFINNSGKIKGLLQDSYANYVIQTALKLANPKQFQQLVKIIKPILYVIRNHPVQKKITSLINGDHFSQNNQSHNFTTRNFQQQQLFHFQNQLNNNNNHNHNINNNRNNNNNEINRYFNRNKNRKKYKNQRYSNYHQQNSNSRSYNSNQRYYPYHKGKQNNTYYQESNNIQNLNNSRTRDDRNNWKGNRGNYRGNWDNSNTGKGLGDGQNVSNENSWNSENTNQMNGGGNYNSNNWENQNNNYNWYDNDTNRNKSFNNSQQNYYY